MTLHSTDDMHLLLHGKSSLTLNGTDLLIHGKAGSSLSTNTAGLCGLRPLVEIARRALIRETTSSYSALSGDSECYSRCETSGPFFVSVLFSAQGC